MQRTLDTVGGPVVASVTDGLIRARGVPYARADRFGPPTAADPWSDPREALRRGPSAPQDHSRLDSVAGDVGGTLAQSEDCLVLTVTAPVDAHSLPVMVWIHGGAYVSGAGEAPEYDADDLARTGVVVVAVTYRLGVLGYLAPTAHGSDNLGVLDQIAALRWVQANIEAFGGDPACVTVFGHSAGGDAIIALMLAHNAAGLFHRAIVQSAPLGLRSGRDPMTTALRDELTQLLPDPHEATTEDVLAAQRRLVVRAADFGTTGGMPFGPRMGSDPLPADADADARLADTAARVELLIGYTAHDAAPFVLMDRRALALTRMGVLGRAVYGLVVRRVTASVFGRPAHELAAFWRESGGRAAEYVFTWAPRAGNLGACHSIELPFLFTGDWSDAPMLGGQTPDSDLAARMRQNWAAFARDGIDGLDARELRF